MSMTEAKGNLRGMTQEEALELQRKMLRDTVPAQGTNAEAIARELALSYGRDPDEPTSIFEMCDADNRPVLTWRVYEEQAEHLLKTVLASLTPAEGEAERIAELQYEAGMYKSLYDAASARVAEISLERDHALGQVEGLKGCLDDSQSLLVAIHHLGASAGAGHGWGITTKEWHEENLSKQLADQISENRSNLSSTVRTPEVKP
jgi:hypothetical protein